MSAARAKTSSGRHPLDARFCALMNNIHSCSLSNQQDQSLTNSFASSWPASADAGISTHQIAKAINSVADTLKYDFLDSRPIHQCSALDWFGKWITIGGS